MVTPRNIGAEAAAWLARLQGDRDGKITSGAFQTWAQEDPEHQAAFEKAAEIWEILPGAIASRAPRKSAIRTIWFSARSQPLALAASLLLLICASIYLLPSRPSVVAYQTAIGEQRELRLSDGTRVTLNSDSTISVAYDKRQRTITFDHGEAIFDVAKNHNWPFVVQSGLTVTRALGTSFMIRRDGAENAVTLFEGQVEIRSTRSQGRRLAVLEPGERLRLISDAGAVIDRPSLEVLTAWRHGELIFDDVSLIDAAMQFNRYNDNPRLSIGVAASQLRISGVFATKAPSEFAIVAARIHNLSIEHSGTTLLLGEGSRAPGQPRH